MEPVEPNRADPFWYGFVPLALSSSPHSDLANVAFHVSHFDRDSFTLPGPSRKLDLAQGSCRGAGGGGAYCAVVLSAASASRYWDWAMAWSSHALARSAENESAAGM